MKQLFGETRDSGIYCTSYIDIYLQADTKIQDTVK